MTDHPSPGGVVAGRINAHGGLGLLPVAVRKDVVKDTQAIGVIDERIPHPCDQIAHFVGRCRILALLVGPIGAFVLDKRFAP